MKCCQVQIADLRHLIVYQDEINSDDSAGGTDINFITKFPLYAKIEQMSASEIFRYQKLQYKATHKFTVRYDSSIIPTGRFVFETIFYNIRSINDLEERNIWLVIIAEKGVPQ